MKNTAIQLEGMVTIRQGDRVLARAANHFVDQGLKSIISLIIFGSLTTNQAIRCAAHGWKTYLGSDTSTPTNTGHTALVSPIGTAPGTPPNSTTGSVKDGSSDGVWHGKYIATWNAGTVSGTVGEAGLYLCLPILNQTAFKWQASLTSETLYMASRLSSADGDFSSFVIDDTVPLTVEWTVQMSFV